MDDNELVERLRWVSEWYFVDPVDGKAYASDDPLDAADRIEALSAENERLLNLLRDCDPESMSWLDARDAALGETE